MKRNNLFWAVSLSVILIFSFTPKNVFADNRTECESSSSDPSCGPCDYSDSWDGKNPNGECHAGCWDNSVPYEYPGPKRMCTFECTYCNNGNTCAYPISGTPPVPTSMPGTPVPTVGPCTCEKVDVEGIIGAGQTITLTTYARSLDPAKNKINSMIYHVEQNGQEITHSEPISAIEVTGEPGRYYTNWTYTIPSDGIGTVDYRIWVDILCAYKTAASQSQTAVLGIGTTIKIGIFDPLVGLIQSIFTPKNGQPAPSLDTNPDSYTILRPTRVNTLQLGTFYPTLKKGCHEISFSIHF